jgi:Fe-S cluster assembly iron-binding protein IscA
MMQLVKKTSKQEFNELIQSVYEKDDKKYVVVDEITMNLLKGSTIDYEQLMIRAGFVVNAIIDT